VAVGTLDPAGLSSLWHESWPACPPIADWLKGAYPDQWVRFHSLPGSKRYADDEQEYAELLGRHNTILDELVDLDFRTAGRLLVVTCQWSHSATPVRREADLDRLQPNALYWTAVCQEDDGDFVSWRHLYVTELQWTRGSLDPILRYVVDDRTAGVMVTGLGLTWIYHPYDGGADVLLPTTAARDALRGRHAGWLSSHPAGL